MKYKQKKRLFENVRECLRMFALIFSSVQTVTSNEDEHVEVQKSEEGIHSGWDEKTIQNTVLTLCSWYASFHGRSISDRKSYVVFKLVRSIHESNLHIHDIVDWLYCLITYV